MELTHLGPRPRRDSGWPGSGPGSGASSTICTPPTGPGTASPTGPPTATSTAPARPCSTSASRTWTPPWGGSARHLQGSDRLAKVTSRSFYLAQPQS